MKSVFSLRSRKGWWFWGSSINVQPHIASTENVNLRRLGYPDIQDKDLGKIHKAAVAGDVARVQGILLLGKSGLNDQDRQLRTALHLAAAHGHQEVVTLLIERKCQLNLCDSENRTALMKAVQCQDEACATLLLEHGADPNVTDIYGETALHSAVTAESTSIAGKLLSHNADIEARNKAGLTPLLIAINERKQEMAEFLIKEGANIHAVDKYRRTALMFAVKCEAISLIRLLLQQGSDVSSEDIFGNTAEEHALSSGFTDFHQLISQFKQEPRLNTSQNRNPVYKCSKEDSLWNKLSIDDSCPISRDDDLDFENQEGATKSVIGKKEDIGSESAPQQQIKNYHLTYVDGRHKTNRSDMTPALGLEEEDVQSLWCLESISECLPEKHIDHLSGAADQREKNILSGQIEDSGKYTHLEPTVKGGDSVTMKAVEMEDVRTFQSGFSDWESTSLKLNKEACQRSWHLKIDDSCPVVAQSIPNQSVLTAFGQTALRDSPGKYTHFEPAIEGRNSVPTKAVEMEDVQTLQSDWDSTVSVFTNETHQRSWNMKIDDRCPVVSQPSIPNQSAFTAFRQMTLSDTPGKYAHLVPTTEGKDSVPMKAVEIEDVQTFQSDLSATLDLEVTSKEVQERLDSSKSNHPWVEGAKEQHKSSKIELSENIYDAADAFDGFIQRRKSGKVDNQLFPITRNEDSERDPGMHMKEGKKKEIKKRTSKEPVIPPMVEKAALLAGGVLQITDDSSLSEIDWDDGRCADKASDGKDKVKQKTKSVDDLDDLIQSSETASEDCKLPSCNYKNFMLLIEQHGANCKDSVSLWKIQDAVLSYERLIELKKNHCELLTGNIKAMKNRFSVLQKELSKAKETKSQIEHQKMEWKRECSNLRETLKQEEMKRKHADIVHKKIKEQLREKKEQFSKEVEAKQQLELRLRALDMELRTVKNNLEQVSGSDVREKDLLHKNQLLRDEIIMLKQEIDTIKNQKQEKEKEYFDDIEIIKEKNRELKKTIRQNKETLAKTIFEHSQQLHDLKAEVALLNSKLENEKQNKERLETEVESCHSRLASALCDHEQSQTSKRDLELTFQRAREEWLHLQEKMNFDLTNLKVNNEILSQKLSSSESKFNSLEIKLQHTREALTEKTSILEDVQRDLRQTQCAKKEIEHRYEKEQGKMNDYIGKQASLEDRVSQLQSENTLLREQLDEVHDKTDNKEKSLVNIQDQFQDILKRLQNESEKQVHMLEEREKELMDECSHLKEQMCQYENEKAGREVIVKQLQQELAESLKKQSKSEASLELTSRYQINLEEEIQYLKTLSQIRSQLQKAQDQHAASVRCAEKMQDHIQKIEIENDKLKSTVKKQGCKIEQLQKNLQSASMMDDLTANPETASSAWPHLVIENQFRQQEFSVKAMQNKCERPEKKKKKLKQVIINLENPMETNLVECCQVEKDMQVVEQTVQDIEEKVKKVNILLQTQATSQKHLEQLIDSHNTSVRNQMELSCKVLETELFNLKTEKDSNRIELEKYKQLYLEEVKAKESLENKLSRTNERLTEVSSKRHMEKMHNRCLLSTFATMPVPGLPYVAEPKNHLVPYRYLTARQNSTTSPTSNAGPSSDNKDIYYHKMKQEFEQAVTRELKEAAAEHEFETCIASLGPTEESKLNQDPLLKASEEYMEILKKKYTI